MVSCLLCHSETTINYTSINNIIYLKCNICKTVFKHPKHFISPEAEKEHYAKHHNDIEDIHYQQFVSPIFKSVIQNFPNYSKGLDFGSGTGPVIKKLLTEKGYQIALYDPFFHADISVLQQKYNFIVCCEVVEHFHHPHKEFKLLKKLLMPGGKLFCMTELIPINIPFEEWYYIKDPTHVIFYSEESLTWIKKRQSFSDVEFDGRLIVFSN